MQNLTLNLRTTPADEKITNKILPEPLNCESTVELIKAQKRIVQPIDLTELEAQSKSYGDTVVKAFNSNPVLYRAMTFNLDEINQMVAAAGPGCEYLRVYFGLSENKQTVFVLPVDSNLTHILHQNMVIVSELPCPPRTGCTNDRIVTDI